MSEERRFTVPVELTQDNFERLSFFAEMSGQTLEDYLADGAGWTVQEAAERNGVDDETLGFAAEERALRAEVNGHRVDRLVEAGKVLPVHRDQVLAFADSLERGDGLSFTAGDASHDAAEWFWSFLEQRPAVVSFGAANLPPELPRGAPAGLKVPQGYTVDPDQSELYALARQLEKERGIPFADAVIAAEEMMKTHG